MDSSYPVGRTTVASVANSLLRSAIVLLASARLTFVLFAMLAFTFTTASIAGTKVRVVGTCRIEVRAELTPNEVNIVGTLNADDGEPVSHASVRLALSGSDDRAPAILNVVTGGDGSFHATMSPNGEGPYSLTATTSATEWVLPAVRTIKVARGKEHPHIWFVGPRPLEINLDQPKVPIDVQVESSVPIDLWLEDSRTHTKIAQTVSATGMAHFVVDSKLLGPPGKGDLSIASVATATSDEAGDSIDTVRGARAIIDAHVTLPGLLSGQTVMVSGSIRDQLGDPMPGAIELFRGKTKLGVATLRSGGRFELRVSGIGDSEPTSVRLHPVASSDGWQVRDDSIEIDARAGVLRHALVLVSLAALVAAFAIAARRSPTKFRGTRGDNHFCPRASPHQKISWRADSIARPRCDPRSRAIGHACRCHASRQSLHPR